MNIDEIILELKLVYKKINFAKEEYSKYLVSYTSFLNYFSKIKGEISKDDLIIGISFTYAWMPTILEFKKRDFENSLKILNRANIGKVLVESDYIELKSLFNNSLVGTSKLLHFINPKQYAIWDSRVYRFLNRNKAPHNNRVQKIDNYINYLNLLSELAKRNEIGELHDFINSNLRNNGFEEVSVFRSIELVMFLWWEIKNEL